MKRLLQLFILLFCTVIGQAQKKDYNAAILGFYNLENLFDTVDNPRINDDEFLPNSARNYNTAIYFDKLKKLATVLSQIGTDVNPEGFAVLGVSEIENDTVLVDLVKQPAIANRNLKFVHYESPDWRGVDVGLLYNPKYFTVLDSRNIYVPLPSGSKEATATRDVLWVKGLLNGEEIHVYVNHWPSRYGGEKRSQPGRVAAAQVCKNHIDSIQKHEPNAKFIVMGDLNDDPTNASVAKTLNAKGNAKDVKPGGLYNPFYDMYKKGYGTLAYQDAWGLFDQIIVSHSFLDKNQDGWFLFQNHIFKRDYLIENTGRYKGYPMRTWSGNVYRGGYSDHFPTYLVLLKEKKQQEEKRGF